MMSPLPFAPVLLNGEAPASTRRMRWLHVVSHTQPRYGGLSSAVPTLVASLAAREGVDVSVAAFCRPDEQYRPPALRETEVSFWPVSRASWMADRTLKGSFADLVRSTDGLHIHGLWEQSTAVACRFAHRFGKPYVLAAHGMLEPWALAQRRLKKLVYAALLEKTNVARAAHLHALTEAEADQYRSFGATGEIAVIPNPVDVPTPLEADLFFSRFPELRDRRLVLFLSRLHPKKGLDLLIEAWSTAAVAHPDARLVIAGPDALGMLPQLKGEVRRRDLGTKVCFTGMLEGPLKWSALAAAEAYVLPSRSEGLSMGLLEAMGSGVPVLATHACNMPQIAAHGAGWETDARVDELAASLAGLLNNSRAENRAKGRNGARLIANRYNSASVAQQVSDVYRHVLGVRSIDRRASA